MTKGSNEQKFVKGSNVLTHVSFTQISCYMNQTTSCFKDGYPFAIIFNLCVNMKLHFSDAQLVLFCDNLGILLCVVLLI